VAEEAVVAVVVEGVDGSRLSRIGVQGVFMTIPKRCDSPQDFCGFLSHSSSWAVIVQQRGHSRAIWGTELFA
jgi:hypothetical protein